MSPTLYDRLRRLGGYYKLQFDGSTSQWVATVYIPIKGVFKGIGDKPKFADEKLMESMKKVNWKIN